MFILQQCEEVAAVPYKREEHVAVHASKIMFDCAAAASLQGALNVE